jgi:hypothetical protein
MTYGALAWYMGEILFRDQKETSGDRHHSEDDEISLTRAGRVPRRRVASDPVVVEDDYFRFRHAPRD